MISATEARVIAEAKISENRKRAMEMTDNFVKICAESGKLETLVGTDDVITEDILRNIAKRYEELGYKCEFKPSPVNRNETDLIIRW